MKNRPPANTVDRDSVDEVRLSSGLVSTYGSSEKAEGVRFYNRVAKPANVSSDAAGLVRWQQCYGALWQLKIAFEKDHNR